MPKKIAIVAVESNLLGRTVIPPSAIEIGTSWPFQTTKEYTEQSAEIVAVYVGSLDEGGALRFGLRGHKSGAIKETYSHAFKVAE